MAASSADTGVHAKTGEALVSTAVLVLAVMYMRASNDSTTVPWILGTTPLVSTFLRTCFDHTFHGHAYRTVTTVLGLVWWAWGADARSLALVVVFSSSLGTV
jgi:hypothetical protein